ncbi:MAG: hypothetical protein FWH19_04430 [Treponema sp.]|nr:hypothetical protein [Treponema sp.]
MDKYSDILRYMGHRGKADEQLEMLISSCLDKFGAVCEPRHVKLQLPCTVTDDSVTMEMLEIKSKALAKRLKNCNQVYLFAASLGAAVDRLIGQRTKMDSAEALCLQACAAARIEEYCDGIEKELLDELARHGLHARPRFSPGYADFDIAHQSDILRILQTPKRIGLTETKTHMLTPLKSVTALIGVERKEA